MQHEFSEETNIIGGRVPHRVRSQPGTLGGFIESEDNSSRDGRAWGHSGGSARERARVIEDARLSGSVTAQVAIRRDSVVHADERGA